jgi:hypothetical protein
MGLKSAGEPISQSPFAARPVVDGRVFPESPNLVEHGKIEAFSRAKGSEPI